MKIIQEGFIPPDPLIGQKFMCEKCDCLFQIEADDLSDDNNPRRKIRKSTAGGGRWTNCPYCKAYIDLEPEKARIWREAWTR